MGLWSYSKGNYRARKEIIVGQYVNVNKIETPFKGGIPGEDWFLNFKKRHHLSIRKPEPLEYARKKAATDPFIIYGYFDLLKKVLTELNLEDKPKQIWNLDESSLSIDPSKSRIVGERGESSSRVIIHCSLYEGLKLKSGTLGVFELFERHTAEYVQRRRLTEILNEWCVSTDKVTAVVTDNDMNLAIDNPLTKTAETASQIIGKEREIVKFIKRSVNASDELRKKQRDDGLKEGQTKKLILDVRTRWNSTFYMLERFLELATTIDAILLCRSDAPPMLTSSEIGCLREIVHLIQPFERLTKEICGQEYVTVSKVIPLISCLRGMLENFSPT
ncbi:unnamed protein product [Colias eurytheme]|nr:unnamed protein product [Colias eurytheme]